MDNITYNVTYENKIIKDFVILSSSYSVNGVYHINGAIELSEKGYIPIGGASINNGSVCQAFALY
jgi:hypothetical protein